MTAMFTLGMFVGISVSSVLFGLFLVRVFYNRWRIRLDKRSKDKLERLNRQLLDTNKSLIEEIENQRRAEDIVLSEGGLSAMALHKMAQEWDDEAVWKGVRGTLSNGELRVLQTLRSFFLNVEVGLTCGHPRWFELSCDLKKGQVVGVCLMCDVSRGEYRWEIDGQEVAEVADPEGS